MVPDNSKLMGNLFMLAHLPYAAEPHLHPLLLPFQIVCHMLSDLLNVGRAVTFVVCFFVLARLPYAADPYMLPLLPHPRLCAT
jgi:hypothetical protein